MLYVRRISAHLQRQANKIQIRSKSGRDCGWEELGECWTSSTGMTPRHQLAKKNKQIERDKQISSRCPHMLSPMLKQKLMMMMMMIVMVMVMVMMMAVLMKIKIMMGMPQKCSTKIKGVGKKDTNYSSDDLHPIACA